MMLNRFAWMLGVFALAACGNDGSSPGTGGPGATSSGGGTNPTGTSGAGGGTTSNPSSSTTMSGSAGLNPTGMATGDGTGGSGVGGNATGGASDSGATGGSTSMDGSVGRDALAPGGCSEPGAGPTPPAGFMKVSMPPDMRFPFTTHWMGVFSDNPQCVSMTSLTDLDNDGDQDFASGQRDPMSSCGVVGAPMVWWEYCTPDHWVRHMVGTGYHSAAAGGAALINDDPYIDLIAGDSWFENPGPGVRTAQQWTRHGTGAPPVAEEITMGDLTGDGKLDVLYVERTFDPQWGTPGAMPTQNWTLSRLSAYRQQQGGAIGDLDGDGKNDILVGDRWWYKNPGGAGTWTPMPIPANPAFAASTSVNGSEPMTMMGDIDGDGDNDIAMHTHWGGNIAWLENRGQGATWALHMIAPNGAVQAKSNLHGLLVDDFDNDGDVDIFIAQNNGTVWIYENTDGKGTFVEHAVATGPGHEARAADVDCDGDLDIVAKPWGNPNEPRNENANIQLRAHIYYKNEVAELTGRKVFDRPKSEVWNVPNKGRCQP
jgi:hypothetical protein